MRRALFLLPLLLSSCLKKEDPQVCYQRHITEHPNRLDYEHCMREYRVRAGLASFEEREARETERRQRSQRMGRAIGAALAGPPADPNAQCRQWTCQQRYNREQCTCTSY